MIIYTSMSISQAIKAKAVEVGFDLAGITDSGSICKKDIEIFKTYLKNDNAGVMDYLHRNFEKRVNPKKLMDGAKSVICVALNYKPLEKSQFNYNPQPACVSADYAKYEDYHKFIKMRLFELAEYIAENFAPDLEFKVCVDSVPLAERSLAVKAGLGFIGKNKMLINPKLGLNLLLGELVTNLELEADEPMKNLCAGCDKCVWACPGGVFAKGSFDSNKCVSYLTTEHKGEFEPDQKKVIGSNLFGCDRCIRACPFYKNAPLRQNSDFKFLDPLKEFSLCDLLYWDENDFKKYLTETSMLRLGLKNLKRNALVCLENYSEDDHGTMNTSISPLGLSQPE